jgi:hypothetical protein
MSRIFLSTIILTPCKIKYQAECRVYPGRIRRRVAACATLGKTPAAKFKVRLVKNGYFAGLQPENPRNSLKTNLVLKAALSLDDIFPFVYTAFG